MKTTISDLSMDLTEEILSRVPLKHIHMRAVRSTCTKWNTLFTSESFMKMQSLKASSRKGEDSMMIVLMNDKLHSVNIDFDDYPSTELKAKTSCLNKQVKISKVVNYEGILLCHLIQDTRLMVWNPYLGQTTWIKPRHSHDRTGYALGYQDKKSCRTLKFLSFIDFVQDDPQYSFSWYEVYDFDSGLWTTLDVTPNWFISYSDALSVKGNIYWLATKRRNNYQDFEDEDEDDEDKDIDTSYRIICFDSTKERFGPFLTLPACTRFNDYVSFSCVGEEKLAVLLQHEESNPYEVEIWITTKLDVETVTWSMFLTMDAIYPKEIPYMSGGFFIHEEKKVAVGFNRGHRKTFSIIGEAGYSIQSHVGKPPDKKPLPTGDMAFSSWFISRMYRPQGFSYVPSFLQIKEPVQGHMTLEEKHRFDQKMSRLGFLRKRQSDLMLESNVAKKIKTAAA